LLKRAGKRLTLKIDGDEAPTSVDRLIVSHRPCVSSCCVVERLPRR
jgi:hypothetical protein